MAHRAYIIAGVHAFAPPDILNAIENLGVLGVHERNSVKARRA